MTLEEASSKNKLTLNDHVDYYDLRCKYHLYFTSSEADNGLCHLTLLSFTIGCHSASYKVSIFKQLDNSTRIKVSAEVLESFDSLKSYGIKFDNLRLIREYRLSFKYIYDILYICVQQSYTHYKLILEREEKNNAEKS